MQGLHMQQEILVQEEFSYQRTWHIGQMNFVVKTYVTYINKTL